MDALRRAVEAAIAAVSVAKAKLEKSRVARTDAEKNIALTPARRVPSRKNALEWRRTMNVPGISPHLVVSNDEAAVQAAIDDVKHAQRELALHGGNRGKNTVTQDVLKSLPEMLFTTKPKTWNSNRPPVFTLPGLQQTESIRADDAKTNEFSSQTTAKPKHYRLFTPGQIDAHGFSPVVEFSKSESYDIVTIWIVYGDDSSKIVICRPLDENQLLAMFTSYTHKYGAGRVVCSQSETSQKHHQRVRDVCPALAAVLGNFADGTAKYKNIFAYIQLRNLTSGMTAVLEELRPLHTDTITGHNRVRVIGRVGRTTGVLQYKYRTHWFHLELPPGSIVQHGIASSGTMRPILNTIAKGVKGSFVKHRVMALQEDAGHSVTTVAADTYDWLSPQTLEKNLSNTSSDWETSKQKATGGRENTGVMDVAIEGTELPLPLSQRKAMSGRTKERGWGRWDS